MYLTRIVLNPRNHAARRDIASPYDMHRTLKRAYPDGEPKENRLLFRAEPSRPNEQGRTVLVQASDTRPDLDFLDAEPFDGGEPYYLEKSGPKYITPSLTDGQQLAFRLLGNPTKKSDGSRIALTKEEDYYDWLDRKADRNGFDILFVHPTPYWINGDNDGQGGYSKREIPHFAVRYDGLLRVTSADDLTMGLHDGIGPAKAFGFGLMTLAPPR
jgi:CRISPR system Cascade subunit CasE